MWNCRRAVFLYAATDDGNSPSNYSISNGNEKSIFLQTDIFSTNDFNIRSQKQKQIYSIHRDYNKSPKLSLVHLDIVTVALAWAECSFSNHTKKVKAFKST